MKNSIKYRFGDRLRDIREKKGITLRLVAEGASVTESLVSQIERNKVSPSIDTLFAIADVLDVDLDYLFRDYRQKRKVSIVRAGEGDTMIAGGVAFLQLSKVTDFPDDHAIEAFIMTIEPGCEKGSPEYGHTGKELGYVLEGEGELLYGTDVHGLRKGDCVSFASDVPHLLRNTGRKVLSALWVITPPKLNYFNR